MAAPNIFFGWGGAKVKKPSFNHYRMVVTVADAAANMHEILSSGEYLV